MPKTTRYWLIPLTLCLVLLSGCSALIGDAREALYPTDTPQPAPQATKVVKPPTKQATAAVPVMPSPTSEGNAVAPATPTPVEDKGLHLVYALDETLYRGGELGEDPQQVGLVPRLEAWDWHDGLLAMASAVDLMLLDLNRGTLSQPDLALGQDVLTAEALWGQDGERVVAALTLGDPQAPTSGRRVQLLSLDGEGTLGSQTTLYDLLGVQLLRFESEEDRVWLIPLAAEGELEKVECYDLASGKLIDSRPISGQGEACLSPDGQFLVTQTMVKGQSALQIFDLQAEGQVRPRVWEHANDATALDPLWSPDSGSLAYLLVKGSGQEAVATGLWLLDLEKMRATQVIADTPIGSELVCWMPDGDRLVGFHRGQEGGSYLYVVRPDGGGLQILGIDASATILGWMAEPKEAVPPVEVDLWQRRFLDAAQDPEALVALVATYVEEGAARGAEALVDEMASYLGLPPEEAPILEQIGSGTFLLEWASSIHLLQSGASQPVSRGHLVEARRQDDRVGLILAIDLMGARQQAFMLLGTDDANEWRVAWMPQGRADWIATDGEIGFGGEGLESLVVRGSSFGLDVGKDEVFVECHDCPHRWFTATWRAENEAYVRETTLGENASRHDMLWEMTEPSAYAVTYEALRRMRLDEPLDALIEKAEVVEQAKALGLDDADNRLVVIEAGETQVRFEDLEGETQYVATVRSDRLVSLAQD